MNDKTSDLESFHIQTLEALCNEATRLKLDLPISSLTAVLREPVVIGGRKIPNRLCVLPMEGCDAAPGGVPGPLTLRRYQRFAEGGFGLIWLEATAVEGQGRSNPHQLSISRRNLSAFTEFVRQIKERARQHWGHEMLILLQLAHAGRYSRPEGAADPLIAAHDPERDRLQGVPADYPVVSDDELDRLQDVFVAAGQLASEAGFDGVDIKASHGDLFAELLFATDRTGQYGGSLENRSRFLCEVIARLKASCPGLMLASKFSLPPGRVDDKESLALAQRLVAAGAQLLNVSTDAAECLLTEPDHPLKRFMRLTEATRAIQQALPETCVVAGGLSWFRHFLPQVAAGVVEGGAGTLVGLGRAALAYPSLAGDLLQSGQVDPDACCINCDACVQLIKDGGHSGCVVMDRSIYGAEYLRRRHFALDNLRKEAKRCRGCAPAPCRSGCPARINVPAFLKAFAEDDPEAAYEILRQSNRLPELCAHLCPVNALCEGRCVAATFDGTPIPIHDIQYAVSWSARQNGLTGVRVPKMDTGKRVAVVGGGPAGISCAATLLEHGHQVVIFERSSRLGGTPELLIRSSRFTGARDEVDAILLPALCEARLAIRYGAELGRNITLEALRRDHDAVFLAAGVWGEKSLGRAEGVVPGVEFLSQVKAKVIKKIPARVVLLAGGDSAMDCARVALECGARELLIVYSGALSEMHWHMEDAWFRTEGVHFMSMTCPVGYRVAPDGKVTGLKIQRILDVSIEGYPPPETILESDLIIEAMGLRLETSLISALNGCSLNEEGLVKTAGGSSMSCGLPGLFAGGGMINGGASVVQCIAEGMSAGCEIDEFLRKG